MIKKLKTIFFGTPDFSIPSLEILSTHPFIELVGVVTMPDRPAGRGQKLTPPPVALYVLEKKIPLYQADNINNELALIQKFKDQKIDLFIVLAFAQFLKQPLLDLPRLGCFNIHTSLLPKYRGAAPIQYAILNADQTTGVSIQKMVQKMDAGDIAYSLTVPIEQDVTSGHLFTKLKFEAARALDQFIYRLISGEIDYLTQDENQVSFAPTIKKEQGYLDFKTLTTSEVINQIKAFDPWPGTYCFLGDQRLKIYSVSTVQQSLNPGQTYIENSDLLVGCLNGTIKLDIIQLEGRKKCSDKELLNGLKLTHSQIIINPETNKSDHE